MRPYVYLSVLFWSLCIFLGSYKSLTVVMGPIGSL